jgi:hypothetical protein
VSRAGNVPKLLKKDLYYSSFGAFSCCGPPQGLSVLQALPTTSLFPPGSSAGAPPQGRKAAPGDNHHHRPRVARAVFLMASLGIKTLGTFGLPLDAVVVRQLAGRLRPDHLR